MVGEPNRPQVCPPRGRGGIVRGPLACRVGVGARSARHIPRQDPPPESHESPTRDRPARGVASNPRAARSASSDQSQAWRSRTAFESNIARRSARKHSARTLACAPREQIGRPGAPIDQNARHTHGFHRRGCVPASNLIRLKTVSSSVRADVPLAEFQRALQARVPAVRPCPAPARHRSSGCRSTHRSGDRSTTHSQATPSATP